MQLKNLSQFGQKIVDFWKMRVYDKTNNKCERAFIVSKVERWMIFMREMSVKKYNTIGFLVAGAHLFILLNLALDLTLIPGINV